MKKYTEENLINKLSLLKGEEIIFLLGAGCSISSGCMPANKLIFEFKKRIYYAKHGMALDDKILVNNENFAKIIQQEYPSDMENPYSYYFEMCYPDPLDRSRFIKDNFIKMSPSYGYLCFAHYLMRKKVKNVFTTNFDNLIEKAIKKLDESYDVISQSDNLSPMLSSDLNIIKLHGDFNYDLIRNTEDELQSLSPKVFDVLINNNCEELIVIGYSGMDKSIMDALEVLSKKGLKIIWCVVGEHYIKNKKVESLLLNNDDSGYCTIEGFDELFSKLYKFLNVKNSIIDGLYQNIKNDNFEFSNFNQPEKIQFNVNKLISNPCCYRISKSISADLIKKINHENLYSFIAQYKNNLYAIGDEYLLKDLLHIPESTFDVIPICSEDLPVDFKCKLIKEMIKIHSRRKGLAVFKDNLYLPSDKKIHEGIEISIDLFNGNICLLTNVNYFSINLEDENVKYQINKMKSSLYAQKNYEKRNELINKIFGDSLKFIVYNGVIEFDTTPLDNEKDCTNAYNCSEEPELIVDKNHSINQIKLLSEYGPRTTLFSNEKIRIGIFCNEENKPKLKRYLNLLVNGTGTRQKNNSIIPEYSGFFSIFKKKLEIEYDALHPFYLNQLINSKMDILKFRDFCIRGAQKLYDERNVDIVLIYIPEQLSIYRKDGEFDLHDSIKLLCSNKYKTQFLEESSIDSQDDLNKKIFNLAMGIYTKTVGMSWYPKNYSKDTLFLGMSFGRDSSGITVGCSQMFDGAGRGMQLIISQISDKQRKNQYLSLDEAYNLGVKIRTTYYKTSKIEALKRVVIHRCDPFRKEEIEGFKKAFEGIEDFDLIQISDYTHFNCYSLKNNKCGGYPVKRGTTIKSSRDTAYVWTDGSICSTDLLNGFTYRNNKRGMGKPLRIKKFYGNISINQVVDDLMYLTKMDFNSSDAIYSKYPVTIKYSQVVCELLKQGNFNDDLISFEYIM